MTHFKQPAAGARAGAKKALPARPTRRVKARTTPAVKAVEKKRPVKGKGPKAKPKVKSPAKVQAPKRVKEVVWTPEMPLPDGQQERFCRLMADGRFSGRSCYAQVFGCDNEGSARTLASRLLTKVDVTDRIDWLKRESVKNWTCEKEEVMRFLHQVIVTPVGYVDEESPLAQEVTRDVIEKGDDAPDVLKTRVKMPGKVESAKLLAQMQGWEKPQEINVNIPYESPNVALERLASRGINLAGLMAKAGILKPK